MADRIPLDNEGAARVEAAARLFLAVVRQQVPAQLDASHAPLFGASVGVQALVKAVISEQPSDDAFAERVLLHAGEGLGQLLGLIPDPATRHAIIASVIRAMGAGAASSSTLHTPAGEA